MGRKRDLDAPQKKSGPGKKAKKQQPPTLSLPGVKLKAGGRFPKSGGGIINEKYTELLMVWIVCAEFRRVDV